MSKLQKRNTNHRPREASHIKSGHEKRMDVGEGGGVGGACDVSR